MITVVGSVNMDAIARVPTLPRPGETVLAHDLSRSPGGKGANQAIAAARAGSEVHFVGRVGDDAYGDELMANFAKQGVHTEHITIASGVPSGMAMIAVDDSGENQIVVVPGANGAFAPAELHRARDLMDRSRVIIAQLEIPIETVMAAAQRARDSGATFILNPAPARPLPPELLSMVDILVPNEEELSRLSGLGSPIDAAASASLLMDTGVRAIVVTRGVMGALVASADGQDEIAAYPSDAQDTTGAGDTFVGNLAHGIDAGLSVGEAARFATAAAALSVREQGAQSAMPTRDETEALIRGET